MGFECFRDQIFAEGYMYYPINPLGWPDRPGCLNPPQVPSPCSACGIAGKAFEIRRAVNEW
jgi:hypothetical protein